MGKALKESKVIFITVGTPSNDDGSANLKQIETVAQQIACYLNDYKVIVNKSTVHINALWKINYSNGEKQNVDPFDTYIVKLDNDMNRTNFWPIFK